VSAPPTSLDRTLAAFRALVRSVYPALRYFGRYRYSVHSATAVTFDGIPVDATVAPALPTGVPYAQALAGSSCVPTQGTIAHVMFADGDPGQPVCVGFERATAVGVVVLPTAATIDATGAVNVGPSAGAVNLGDGFARLVREGDTYTLGTATGPLTFVSTLDPNGPTKGKG
jgi:hypothetical protein